MLRMFYLIYIVNKNRSFLDKINDENIFILKNLKFYSARESSFQDRLRQNPNMSPTPEEFAACGFFSNPGGSEDRDSVTCYYW